MNSIQMSVSFGNMVNLTFPSGSLIEDEMSSTVTQMGCHGARIVFFCYGVGS